MPEERGSKRMDAGVEVEPLLDDFGAVVRGVSFCDPGATEILQDLVHAHGLIFLRDQRMSDAEHIEAAGRFGELGVYPLQAAAGAFEPLEFIEDGPDDPPKADGWHSDVSWIERPPVMAFLSMLEVPDRGGDTLWVDTAKAFETLSPRMQAIAAGLSIYHDISEANRQLFLRKWGQAIIDRTKARYGMGASHPLVRAHPVTGRRSLYLAGYFMRHIEGLAPAESEALLGFLMAHATAPERALRWRWREHDLAIWDERRTMHRALGDHFPRRRRVRRCTVLGERPIAAAP
ncbi:MAG: TauD/TfdA family dioxygenase [Myxococcota bacterium]